MNQPAPGECFALPASFSQERLWLLDRLGTGRAYHITGALRLDGALDVAALGRAVDTLVDRHEVLRTTFEFGRDGALVQLIHPNAPVSPRQLAVPESGDRTAAACDALAGYFGEPFDLAAGPLVRPALVRLGPESWLLGVSVHHVVADGWSVGVLLADLAELYRAQVTGLPARLPELPVQYGDFAAWQRDRAAGSDGAAEDFWRATLAHAQPVRPAGAGPDTEPVTGPWPAGAVPVTVPCAAVRALARDEAVTPFMVMLAAYAAVLSRWTELDDVVIGTPVAGRDRPELAGLVGCFVNTVPLRIAVRAEDSFRALLEVVRDTCVNAFTHQDVPFERIVELSGVDRSPSRPPLLGALIGLRNTPVPAWDVPGLAAEQVELTTPYAQFGLSLHLSEDADGRVTGELRHATPVWDDADAARLAEGWQALLSEAVARPGTPVGRLPLGPPAPAATGPAVAGECVHRAIEQTARRHPDRFAVVAGTVRLTYRELDEQAGRLARRLRLAGAGPDRLVGICAHRSVAQVVALLAVLKSGSAYLPLDAGHPADRLHRLIDEAAPVALLTDHDVAASGLFDGRCGPTVMVVDAEQWPSGAPGMRSSDADERSLAYVIHTSGSTGTPKGAMNEHAAVANRIHWMRLAFPLTPGEAVLYKTPLGFDVSAWEWIWPLTAGGRVVVAAPDGHRDPRYLARVIVEESVTTCHFVPSMLSAFLAEPTATGCAAVLRRVLCSGEELTPALARRFQHVLPGVELHNLYGPAEAAIDVTWRRVAPADLDRARVPVGRPLPGVRLHVLDRGGEPVPPGVPGELHIGGVAVGRGYLGRPGLTAARFVPDPFHGGGRLYRTGDRVLALPDGTIDFLGRYDHQVKVRGVRVEPGEIEAVLGTHPDVRRCVVVATTTGPVTDRRLVAYLECAARAPGTAELRAFLLRRLPAGLVPEVFVVLPALPVTANGKLDRAALPDPRPGQGHRAEPVPPRTAVEQLLAAIWAEVLETSQFGVTDNFYELGGNSLRAVAVFQRAQDEGLLLPLPVMLGDHSIEQLAARAGDDPRETLREIGQVLG